MRFFSTYFRAAQKFVWNLLERRKLLELGTEKKSCIGVVRYQDTDIGAYLTPIQGSAALL